SPPRTSKPFRFDLQPQERDPPMEINQDSLVSAAMQIIILAGDARRLTFEAGDALAAADFTGAGDLLDQAQQKVRDAHRIHTDCIQAAAAGEDLPYSMLFAHAQDTLMTVNSEFRLVRKLAVVFERIDTRLVALEGAAAAGVEV
ncbi:MAG: PTS lactose/cellobiose transporter subunit IIA, partial [Propionibacteriaceae bacterium]|nr:PTS lactose/cellobiose transporter subunit IIA [Propionibacteriaceae bacterium]